MKLQQHSSIGESIGGSTSKSVKFKKKIFLNAREQFIEALKIKVRTVSSNPLFQNLNEKAMKKVKYYPNSYISKEQHITEFQSNLEGNSLKDKLDPDTIEFNAPDFGYNNFLSFDEDTNDEVSRYQIESCKSNNDLPDMHINGWKKFLDFISLYPKHERVQNYIQFMNGKHLEKHFQPSTLLSPGSNRESSMMSPTP